MNEREKIIEIIAPYISAYGEDEAIADALISAGIGDVTEYKHRAKVAFRALLICMKDSRPAHCSITGCSKWTRCGDDACVETRRDIFIEQAEKELAEDEE